MATSKRRIIDALWREKMHIEPDALDRSPLSVQKAYRSIWEPGERARNELAAFPTGLLSLWQTSARGELIMTHRESEYLPGAQDWGGQTFEGICYLSIAQLMLDRRRALVAFIDMIDHLLGSDAAAGSPWFADGAGVTEKIREAAQRFVVIHALGYGHSELGVSTARDYMAHTWALYLTEPRELNVLDPLVHKLYRTTLMDEGFWAQP